MVKFEIGVHYSDRNLGKNFWIKNSGTFPIYRFQIPSAIIELEFAKLFKLWNAADEATHDWVRISAIIRRDILVSVLS